MILKEELERLAQFDQVRKQTDDKKEEKYGTRHAVVIGINEYEDAEIQTLNGAENDAKEISERLHDKGDFEISTGHLLLGRDATKKNILRALSDIFRKNVNYDIVTIYFSGYILVDNYDVGYIAPYDIDPEDPSFSSIKLDELRSLIIQTKNQASVMMFLDYCILQKRGLKSILDIKGNLIYNQLVTDIGRGIERGARDVSTFESSEANAVLREQNDYVHSDDDKPHSHGAFTFHLIEGIDGKAAEESGIITVDSLRKYVEDQMLMENRRRPTYCYTGGGQIDSIHVAISPDRFRITVDSLVDQIKEGVDKQQQIASLYSAAKKLVELEKFDPNNPQIPIFKDAITKSLQTYNGKLIGWLDDNMGDILPKINKISPEMYPALYSLEDYLVYDKFVALDDIHLRRLSALCDIINNKTSADIFVRRLTPT